jgi:hypothetical protein
MCPLASTTGLDSQLIVWKQRKGQPQQIDSVLQLMLAMTEG